MMLTWASSTWRSSTAPSRSTSSRRVWPARSDMLLVTLIRTSSLTPLSAIASSPVSTWRSTSWRSLLSSSTMSSNMNIRLLTSSASSGSRASRASTMSRSVARSERLMMSISGSRPPTAESSDGCSTEEVLRSRHFSSARSTSGEVRSITAIRWATSACRSGSRPDSTSVARSLGMCARITAITCGCSPEMNDRSWRGSARCRNWKGICRAAAASRSMIESARSRPRDSSSRARAKSGPPLMTLAWAVAIWWNSVMTASVSSALSDSSREISEETASTSLSRRWLSTLAALSWPSWTSRIAALRMPASLIVAVIGSPPSPPASRGAAGRLPRAVAPPSPRSRHGRRRAGWTRR